MNRNWQMNGIETLQVLLGLVAFIWLMRWCAFPALRRRYPRRRYDD